MTRHLLITVECGETECLGCHLAGIEWCGGFQEDLPYQDDGGDQPRPDFCLAAEREANALIALKARLDAQPVRCAIVDLWECAAECGFPDLAQAIRTVLDAIGGEK